MSTIKLKHILSKAQRLFVSCPEGFGYYGYYNHRIYRLIFHSAGETKELSFKISDIVEDVGICLNGTDINTGVRYHIFPLNVDFPAI